MAGARLSSLPYFEKWFVLGIVLGVVAGLAAITFYSLLRLFEFLFMAKFIGMSYPRPIGDGGSLDFVFRLGRYFLVPVSLMIGGLISGLIVYTFAPEAEGHGTDAAIKAYHYLQGKVRWVVIPVKILASAVTIGSGGSAGREGPTAQFSSGIGSLIADLLGLPPEDRRRAVAVGIGAGIGTIFKTPIGGALLASEILYRRDLEPELIYPGLIASSIGYTIFGSVFGFTPIFGYYSIPFNPLRLPLYALLGAAAGALAVLYIKSFYGFASLFKRLNVPNHVKPMIGGGLAGIVALVAPEVMGTGYGWINLAEFQRFSQFYSPVLPLLALLALLPIMKILATSLSIGSGGSGGVFAPGLFIGAFLGADVGLAYHYLFPALAPSIAPFVIVGMMSFFAAAGKVPLSVMVMVTEMTSSLQLLPGAMIAVAVSYLVSGSSTIYSSQVPTRRESPAHRGEYETPILRKVKVSRCKLMDLKVSSNDEVGKAIAAMMNAGLRALPVVDPGNKFLGVVYLNDVINQDQRKPVGEFAQRGSPYVTPSSTLEQAWEVMNQNKTSWVAVIDGGEFRGIVTLGSLLEAYKEVSSEKGEAVLGAGQ